MNKLGFGFLRLPQKGGGEFDWEALSQMVDLYIQSGKRFFDTCYTYLDGNSELGIKKCVTSRYPREAFELANKLPGYLCKTYDDCRKYFNEQLERCGVDYFDVYMLHWLNEKHYQISEKVDQFRFLRELREQGLAKRIGFSYHDSAALLERILSKHPEIDIVLLQINYLDWETAGIESRKCYEVCVKHGKTVMVMEPIKGGTLAQLPEEAVKLLHDIHEDWTPSDWALRFAQSLPEVEICLSGMNEISQIEANSKDFDPLTESELLALSKVREIIEMSTAVPCTGCRYCETHCPKQIAIPDYFKMYNEISRFPDDGWKIVPVYQQLALNSGKASDCISCRKCEAHCPQHIEISRIMKKVASTFE